MKRRKKISDSSNTILTVSQIVDNIQSVKKEESVSIEQILRLRIQELEAELKELKLSKLTALVPNNNVSIILRPDEKEIAILQLERLKEKAINQELTLEEARKFEIFSKMKVILDERDKTSPTIPYTTLPSDDKELTQIAASSTSLEKKLENE